MMYIPVKMSAYDSWDTRISDFHGGRAKPGRLAEPVCCCRNVDPDVVGVEEVLV